MNKVERVVKMVANLSKEERVIFDQKFAEFMAAHEATSTKAQSRKKSATKRTQPKISNLKRPS